MLNAQREKKNDLRMLVGTYLNNLSGLGLLCVAQA